MGSGEGVAAYYPVLGRMDGKQANFEGDRDSLGPHPALCPAMSPAWRSEGLLSPSWERQPLRQAHSRPCRILLLPWPGALCGPAFLGPAWQQSEACT